MGITILPTGYEGLAKGISSFGKSIGEGLAAKASPKDKFEKWLDMKIAEDMTDIGDINTDNTSGVVAPTSEIVAPDVVVPKIAQNPQSTQPKIGQGAGNPMKISPILQKGFDSIMAENPDLKTQKIIMDEDTGELILVPRGNY